MIAECNHCKQFNNHHSVRVYKSSFKHNGWYESITAIIATSKNKEVLIRRAFDPTDRHHNISHYNKKAHVDKAHRFLNRASLPCSCLLDSEVQQEAFKRDKDVYVHFASGILVSKSRDQ